jgi:hypothetical protein
MLKYKITNRFIKDDITFVSQNTINRGVLTDVSVISKEITVPFVTQTKDTGYSDLISELFTVEKNKNVNTVIDNEKIKFYASKYTEETKTNITFLFYFYNQDNNSFNNNFLNAGFTDEEVTEFRNNFRNSFFRIDFYDSDNIREQNFLFSEFLNVESNTITSNFTFDRIFYKKEDPKFTKDDTFVDLYFEILFFDAKTGVVKNLINTPNSGTLSLQQFNANPSWRFAKVKLLNPYFNLPGVGSLNRLFKVEPINGNSDTQIRFTELIIQ